jgi:hypothetical protein
MLRFGGNDMRRDFPIESIYQFSAPLLAPVCIWTLLGKDGKAQAPTDM